jgi:hypothetical protein
LHRVFWFGCTKDAATLEQILPAALFEGIGVSDDAAVYRDRFGQGQKCWAHLLRKAIRLTLLYPRRKRYRNFLDALLGIFSDGKRAAADKRLGDAGQPGSIHLGERGGRGATVAGGGDEPVSKARRY